VAQVTRSGHSTHPAAPVKAVASPVRVVASPVRVVAAPVISYDPAVHILQ
jgi:hypothetical protein